jgi:cysteine-rich repeat protein
MKMKTRAHLPSSLLLLPLVLLVACSDDTSEASGAGTDTGTTDTGAGDTGTTDTGSDTTVDDTDPADTGSDTSVDDTGTTDTGSDTTVDDTGTTDTGTTDTGTTDTGTGPVTGVPPLINEVSAGSTPDWFEIYNPNDEPLSLNDFYFSDDELAPQRTLFPFGVTIPARGYYQQTLDAIFPGFALGAAETLVIADTGGVIVDTVTWIDGDSPAGESYGRFPNGDGPFKRLYTPTPGTANIDNPPPACGDGRLDAGEACDDGNTTAGDGCDALCVVEFVVADCGNGAMNSGEECDDSNTLDGDGCDSLCVLEAYTGLMVINEAQAGSSLGVTDWIEFTSIASFPFRLDAFAYSDNQPDLHRVNFAAGTILYPDDFVTVGRDEPTGFTWGLGVAGDGLRLYAPDSTLIDTTDWTDGQCPIDSAWSRLPDGTGPFTTNATPSRGEPNF